MNREAERKRLVELMVSKSCRNNECTDKPCTECKCITIFEDDAELLADHLLDNGIVVPPCKVGDKVYEFFDVKGFYDISELIVENVVVGVNPPKCNIYTKSSRSGSKEVFYRESFGKTLFFTREQAEKALEGKGE